jgi:hypothetical protein
MLRELSGKYMDEITISNHLLNTASTTLSVLGTSRSFDYFHPDIAPETSIVSHISIC